MLCWVAIYLWPENKRGKNKKELERDGQREFTMKTVLSQWWRDYFPLMRPYIAWIIAITRISWRPQWHYGAMQCSGRYTLLKVLNTRMETNNYTTNLAKKAIYQIGSLMYNNVHDYLLAWLQISGYLLHSNAEMLNSKSRVYTIL